MQKRYLISGASGFLGRNLLEYLAQDSKAELITIGRTPSPVAGIRHLSVDLALWEPTRDAVRQVRPTHVFHLAGAAKISQEFGMEDYFRSNTLSTKALLDGLSQTPGPVRFFLASSVHVYGNQTVTVQETDLVRPAGLYGFSKYLAERELEEATKRPGSSIIGVAGRLYSCIGPGQKPGFVVSDIARRLATLPDDGQTPLQTGPLSATRRFLDVRDAVRVFPKLLEATPQGFEIYNIASAHEFEIREIVTRLIQVAGRTNPVESHERESNPFKGLRVDVSKLKSVIAEDEFRPIESTLQDMWESLS